MVFELFRVTEGDVASMPLEDRQSLQGQLGTEYGGMVDTEFQRSLRDAADITVL